MYAGTGGRRETRGTCLSGRNQGLETARRDALPPGAARRGLVPRCLSSRMDTDFVAEDAVRPGAAFTGDSVWLCPQGCGTGPPQKAAGVVLEPGRERRGLN